jgi:hypothetical protein
MRVLVCGGRNYQDRQRLFTVLDGLPIDWLIAGDCPTGADMMAHRWAYERGVPASMGDADWKTYGRSAGSICNQWMLDEGKPDLVVAFPGGAGTADTVRRATAAGIAVMQEGVVG